jgi:hypothetical protein
LPLPHMRILWAGSRLHLCSALQCLRILWPGFRQKGWISMLDGRWA